MNITRTAASVTVAALVGTTLAMVPTAPAGAAVCLPNGPVTYTPAPGAAPITVPRCPDPLPTPVGAAPKAKKPAVKYVKVCGQWWKRVPKGTRGAGTLRNRKGWYVLVRECRWVKR